MGVLRGRNDAGLCMVHGIKLLDQCTDVSSLALFDFATRRAQHRVTAVRSHGDDKDSQEYEQHG